MPIEKFKPNFSFDEERIKKLKEIAPEAFTDNQINWEVLREALGDYLEEDDLDTEHFGLFWPGKREARRIASIPSKGTLVPVYGEGLKKDGTLDDDGKNNSSNIFIEGENLEVLKILQKSYAGRIKMIYIDPPYNTGNDFVYDDNFTEPLEEYLRRTGQIDEEGKPLTTNKKADGRFHSKWLSMMYPRLRLARNLLRDDGIIFLSIDDNEVHNLINLMNEIFGEENREGIITWRRRHNQPNDKTKVIGKVAEYILVYSKNSEFLKLRGTFYGVPLSEKRISDYKNPDKDPNGPWTTNPWKAAKGRGGSKYQIITPTGIKHNETWYGNYDTFNDLVKMKRVRFSDNGNGLPRIKIYLNEAMQEGQSAINFLKHEDFGSNQEASSELADLFNGEFIFDNPKPTRLLSGLLNIATDKNDIVLDFFAGSGSLGHSVYKTEKSLSKVLKFILVQQRELLDDSEAALNAKSLGYKSISDICLHRLINSSQNEFINDNQLDFGVRVFKLEFSSFKSWQPYNGDSLEILDDLFEKQNISLKDGWHQKNLLSEILLIEGFPLDSHIEKIELFDKNHISKITSDYCEHKLIICLDEKVQSDTIKDLQLEENDIFICLDTAITDQEKVLLSDKGLIKTI